MGQVQSGDEGKRGPLSRKNGGGVMQEKVIKEQKVVP